MRVTLEATGQDLIDILELKKEVAQQNLRIAKIEMFLGIGRYHEEVRSISFRLEELEMSARQRASREAETLKTDFAG